MTIQQAQELVDSLTYEEQLKLYYFLRTLKGECKCKH